MLYAYAALLEGVPFANVRPTSPSTCRACASSQPTRTSRSLARISRPPDTDEDGPRTDGEARQLGLSGWYSTTSSATATVRCSTRPRTSKTKEESKLGVLEDILQPKKFPDLYGDIFHKVQINYYPPRGDNKEGWTTSTSPDGSAIRCRSRSTSWCRDSILAAPLALDLVLFSDLAQRAGMVVSRSG